ncbi:MAG: hypothetical protein ABJI96_18925 [Paracoccaceae bacterium]
MNTGLIALVALVIGTLSASADTFRAINWLYVNPITETEFEVVLKPGASPRATWCAAADYSGKRLGRYNKTDLVVLSAAGPGVTQSRFKGVVFTIDPSRLETDPTQSYSVTIYKVGAMLSVGHAKTFCPFYPGPFYN